MRQAALCLVVLATGGLLARLVLAPMRWQGISAALAMIAANGLVAVLPARYLSAQWRGPIVTLSFVALCCATAVWGGGVGAPIAVLACTSPLIAALLVSRRAAVLVAVLLAGYFVLLGFASDVLQPATAVDPTWIRVTMLTLSVSIVALLAFLYDRENSRLRHELRRDARTDSLTGIANRRSFEEAFRRESARAFRTGEPLTVLMIDIDYFKRLNDEFGHATGDACLVRVAETVNQAARRATDAAARVGGEEFALLLPSTPLRGGLLVAEAVRSSVARLKLPNPNTPFGSVTVSIGVASGVGREPEDLRVLADRALYEAKDSGRNRVSVAKSRAVA